VVCADAHRAAKLLLSYRCFERAREEGALCGIGTVRGDVQARDERPAVCSAQPLDGSLTLNITLTLHLNLTLTLTLNLTLT
jgi:hypothetical protein